MCDLLSILSIYCRNRSSLYNKSEFLYTLPASAVVDSRRSVVLDSLERSYHENGQFKQFSGYGASSTTPGEHGMEYRNNHISDIFRDEDSVFAIRLANSKSHSFPIKRLYNLCNVYESVWRDSRTRSRRGDSVTDGASAQRGPLPYVDDKATVLGELTKAEILKTRHRVNSNSNPKWALRTIRRRGRKQLVKLKKRSISQERIRVLQAKLISSKAQNDKGA